ncbi:MAG TPA: hypothetical protein PLD59_11610 [Tepidisphaeraceae bacterium]|nr:hypothetical protein [Tepidisphaeraceae bacterium]
MSKESASKESAVAIVLLISLVSTGCLIGLIWTVQLVHYPLLTQITPENWNAYHQQHMKTITVIVAPLMFIEAMAAAVLVFLVRDASTPVKLAVWTAAVLVLVNWISTAGVQVPLHNELGKRHDPAVIQRLVSGNWIRTAAWTARGALLCFVAWKLLTLRATALAPPKP